MNNPALDGVRAKIGRAEFHFNEINSACKILLGAEDDPNIPPPYEFNDERKHLIVRAPKPKPVDPNFRLMVGDAIHNLRCALDHLVLQLAILNGKGTEAESKTAFPVYLTSEQFNNFVRKNVAPFVSASALTIIERMQPYKARNLGAHSGLWVLSQLDIIDKHRLLVIVSQEVKTTGFTITIPTGEVLTEKIKNGMWKPLEEGTEIIRFDLSQAIYAPGEVHVQVETEKLVHLKDTGLICDKLPLQSMLNDCIRIVHMMVNEFGRKFFGE